MKQYLSFVFLLLSIVGAHGQSLNISDFEKYVDAPTAFNYSFLKNKGFQANTDEIKSKNPSYVNTMSGEIIKIDLSENSDGAITLFLDFYLPSESNYNNFVSSLKGSKYKNKSKTIFEHNTSSYSSFSFEAKGSSSFQNKKYFQITFKNTQGKELGVVK